jgi:glutaredoxin 3
MGEKKVNVDGDSIKVVVYSKANCPQCVKVKNELTLKGVPFTEVRVDLNPMTRDWLVGEGHRSVPQVYVNGMHTQPENLTSEIVN